MRRTTKRQVRLILFGAAAAMVAFLGYNKAAIKSSRSVPDEPLKVAGNLYYVGSTRVTTLLLTGPEGHVLIDGGYPETAPLIIGSSVRNAW